MIKRKLLSVIIISLFFFMFLKTEHSVSQLHNPIDNTLFPSDMNIIRSWGRITTDSGIQSSPLATDIDRDGDIEIICGGSDYILYCLTSSGGIKWRYNCGDEIYLCVPSIADLDKDGKFEVLFSSETGYLYCLNYTGGLMWQFDLGERVVELRPQQGFLVPKGVVHRTRALERTAIILVEGNTVEPTGD